MGCELFTAFGYYVLCAAYCAVHNVLSVMFCKLCMWCALCAANGVQLLSVVCCWMCTVHSVFSAVLCVVYIVYMGADSVERKPPLREISRVKLMTYKIDTWCSALIG